MARTAAAIAVLSSTRSSLLLCLGVTRCFALLDDESLKAYLAPTGLVSEPRGDLTCRGVDEPWKLYVLYEPECVGV